MNKYFIINIVFILFNINLSFSTEEIEGKTSGPSLKTAVVKVVAGAGSVYCANFGYDFARENQDYSTETLIASEIAMTCGMNAIFSGTYDLLHWGYDKSMAYLYGLKRSPKKIKRPHKSRSSLQKRPRKVKKEDDLRWNKTVNIARSLTNTSFSALNFLFWLQNEKQLVSNGFSPFSLYAANCMENTNCHPVVMSGYLCLSGIALTYNILELTASLRQKKKRQGDRPIMGLLSSWSETVVASQVFEYLPPRQIISAFDTTNKSMVHFWVGSPLGEYIHDSLAFHGQYQMFLNLYQIGRNAMIAIRGKSNVDIEPSRDGDQVELPHQRKKKYFKLENKAKREVEEEMPDEDQVLTLQMLNNNSADKKEKIKKKKKIKTRGKPDPSKARQKFHELYQENDSPKDEETNTDEGTLKKRNETLHKINELRRFNTVKKKHIDGLLSQVCKFLEAKISPVSGSEVALVFFRGKQKVSIKYEEPHGKESNSYTGFKLKRVLNALETSCMYDWDEKSIRSYMENKGIVRFYTIPKEIIFTLWTRPDLDS